MMQEPSELEYIQRQFAWLRGYAEATGEDELQRRVEVIIRTFEGLQTDGPAPEQPQDTDSTETMVEGDPTDARVSAPSPELQAALETIEPMTALGPDSTIDDMCRVAESGMTRWLDAQEAAEIFPPAPNGADMPGMLNTKPEIPGQPETD